MTETPPNASFHVYCFLRKMPQSPGNSKHEEGRSQQQVDIDATIYLAFCVFYSLYFNSPFSVLPLMSDFINLKKNFDKALLYKYITMQCISAHNVIICSVLHFWLTLHPLEYVSQKTRGVT